MNYEKDIFTPIATANLYSFRFCNLYFLPPIGKQPDFYEASHNPNNSVLNLPQSDLSKTLSIPRKLTRSMSTLSKAVVLFRHSMSSSSSTSYYNIDNNIGDSGGSSIKSRSSRQSSLDDLSFLDNDLISNSENYANSSSQKSPLVRSYSRSSSMSSYLQSVYYSSATQADSCSYDSNRWCCTNTPPILPTLVMLYQKYIKKRLFGVFGLIICCLCLFSSSYFRSFILLLFLILFPMLIWIINGMFVLDISDLYSVGLSGTLSLFLNTSNNSD